MRSIIIPIARILLLAVAAFAQSTENAGFAGTWLLDASKSKGLPPYYANIENHRLDIKQTKTALNVDVDLTFKNGNEPFRITLNYPLDGATTRTTMPIRTPQGPKDVPATLSGAHSDDGTLILNIVNELEMNGKPFKGLTTETWQLADEGKSLIIHLSREAPQGKMEYDLLFVRQ